MCTVGNLASHEKLATKHDRCCILPLNQKRKFKNLRMSRITDHKD